MEEGEVTHRVPPHAPELHVMLEKVDTGVFETGLLSSRTSEGDEAFGDEPARHYNGELERPFVVCAGQKGRVEHVVWGKITVQCGSFRIVCIETRALAQPDSKVRTIVLSRERCTPLSNGRHFFGGGALFLFAMMLTALVLCTTVLPSLPRCIESELQFL